MAKVALKEAEALKPVVLYFEDDAQTSNMIRGFLDIEGYEVIHYPSLPDNYAEVLSQAVTYNPVMVILDINMPGIDGYQICETLRSGILSEHTPIVFTSGLMDESDILRAYESGGDDYITKPLKLSELRVKLSQQLKRQKEKEGISERLDMAQKMAFKAMTSSSELGAVLQFNERCIQISDRKNLARALIEACKGFSLQSSVYIEGSEGFYLNEQEQGNLLEQKTMEILRSKPRVYSWDSRTILNFKGISLLVKNMPIHDEERYGEIKDLICLLMNGVEARLHAIAVEERERAQQTTIQKAAESVGEIVLQMEQSKLDLAYRFEKIIESMEDNVSADILQFNLLQDEEKVLLDHISLAMTDARKIFDQSAKNEKEYRDQLGAFLSRLNGQTVAHSI